MFWFDGEYLFVMGSGAAVTIDDSHPYRLTFLKSERKQCHKFHLQLYYDFAHPLD
jgi:hypothetical protein